MRLRSDRLKELRKARGWSQRELGRHCGFGATMIAKYETDATDISATHLSIMADLFGVSTDYLLGRTDQPSGQGLLITGLTEDEQELIEVYRKAGWGGVLHKGVDRLMGKENAGS